ncbi:diguanylate cyclase [Gammaproteobacteria bacterium AS21]
MSQGIEESFFVFLHILLKGLEGHSASLDTNLNALRRHMLESKHELPEELVNNIEYDIRILHLERQESCQDFLDVLEAWCVSLKKNKFNSEKQLQLDDVSAELKSSKTLVYQLPNQFKVLMELQNIADKSTHLLERKEAPDTGTLVCIANEMINLLSHITPSKGASDNHQALLTQLETGIEIDKLPVVIYKISELIESALALKGDDFSNYLQSINKQLSEVQDFISKTQNIDGESAVFRDAADTKVREGVDNIRASVSSAQDIASLQSQLSEQLNDIVCAMDVLQEQEKTRESNLQKNYDALKQRVSTMEDEAEHVQEYIEEERKQARQDALTALPNRMAYNEIISHQLATFQRYKTPLSLVVCDLDHFKDVNDNYGHLAGDKVLSLVAKILSKGTRASDFVTRYGGEEFAIIIPSTGAEEAAQVMDKIRRIICKSPFNYRGEPISISMSFGISEAQVGDSAEMLFSRADAALYTAKHAGRNAIKISGGD